MLHGVIPDGIGKLSNLTYLILGSNNFSSALSEDHFSSLVNLKYLNISHSSLRNISMMIGVHHLDYMKDYLGHVTWVLVSLDG
jgi:Leucine-rich repeat (LRR) protein